MSSTHISKEHCANVATHQEMALVYSYGRYLIIVQGQSVLENFCMDRAFGGARARASVGILELRNALRTLFARSRFTGSSFKVHSWWNEECILINLSSSVVECRTMRLFDHALLVHV